ncbi:flavin reductase [Phytopseudomonas dryadis]|uniref:flavin reductase n=1 Tax=Phytopseudomonas dryadis TaxID=2487520 RepID=UPI001A954C65|nr:flavin reductase [Pseudomonas dryadis]
MNISNCSCGALDTLAHFGLTPTSAQTVGTPMVRGCWANLECRLADDGWACSYNLWVLKVQRIGIDIGRDETRLIHHQRDGRFSVDGNTLDLNERMAK